MSDDDRSLKARIEEEMIVESDDDDPDPETRGRAVPVSAAECAAIRRRRRAGETTTDIGADLGITSATVSRHARGDERCPHDSEEVGPPFFSEIRADECAAIRERRRAGQTVTAIAHDLGRTRTAVSHHATDATQCHHDPDDVGEPVVGSGGAGRPGPHDAALSPGDCAAIRARRRVGESLEAVAELLDRSTGTISEHARGGHQCSHDPAVVGPPLDDAPPKKSYSDADLLDFLREFAADHNGQPPRFNEANATEEFPATQTFINHFGSWNAAVEAAGFTPRDRRRTDEELLAALRALAADCGERPTAAMVAGREDMASPGTYGYRFGSWNEALDAAGLATLDHGEE